MCPPRPPPRSGRSPPPSSPSSPWQGDDDDNGDDDGGDVAVLHLGQLLVVLLGQGCHPLLHRDRGTRSCPVEDQHQGAE